MCLGFSQMTMTLPCLLMILHFSQIFFTDGLTFIGYQPFLNLFRTPGDTALFQVVDGNLNGYLITGQNFDIIHAQLSGNMSRDHVLIRQLDLEGRVGQCLNDDALKLNNIVLRQKNPSLRFRMCGYGNQKLFSISVRISTSPPTIATVFS